MSCNPAIGGIGKGHLVAELDALGGIQGWAADRAGIQFRTLNASKGLAVRATRAQVDMFVYSRAATALLGGAVILAATTTRTWLESRRQASASAGRIGSSRVSNGDRLSK